MLQANGVGRARPSSRPRHAYQGKRADRVAVLVRQGGAPWGREAEEKAGRWRSVGMVWQETAIHGSKVPRASTKASKEKEAQSKSQAGRSPTAEGVTAVKSTGLTPLLSLACLPA